MVVVGGVQVQHEEEVDIKNRLVGNFRGCKILMELLNKGMVINYEILHKQGHDGRGGIYHGKRVV